MAAISSFLEKWAPPLTLVIGGLWAVYVYVDHDRSERAKDAVTRRFEVQKPFLTKQSELYFETAKLVGQLVTLPPDDPEWSKANNRFLAFYWSELAMMETPAVESAMVDFRQAYRSFYDIYLRLLEAHANMRANPELQGPREAQQQAALRLAHAIREAISESWKLPEISPQTAH